MGFLREVTLVLSPAGTLEDVPMELLQENLVPVGQEAFKQRGILHLPSEILSPPVCGLLHGLPQERSAPPCPAGKLWFLSYSLARRMGPSVACGNH